MSKERSKQNTTDNMTQLDHWDRNIVQFLNIHLKSAIQTIRIATGFFTIQGYNLLRHGFEDKRIFLLVGFDENSTERLKAKMVEDIMAHLAFEIDPFK